MGGERYRCLTLSVKSLLVLLTLNLANVQNVSGIVNITECSVQQLNFTLTEELDLNSDYRFLAACKDNGECVDGELPLGNAEEFLVGRKFTVDMHPNCTLSQELSPNGTELCTLLISSTNAFHDSSGTLSTVCTLTSVPTTESEQPPSSTGAPNPTAAILPVVSSTSMQTTVYEQHPSSSVKPSPSGTVAPGFSTLVLVAIILVPLFH